MELYAVRIFVHDWDRACDFYRDVLELPERYCNGDVGWAEYDLGGPCFGVERVDPDDEDKRQLVGRMLGVSLHVDDIDGAYDELRARGAEFLGPPERQPWGGSLAHLRDPEGNVLTLLG